MAISGSMHDFNGVSFCGLVRHPPYMYCELRHQQRPFFNTWTQTTTCLELMPDEYPRVAFSR